MGQVLGGCVEVREPIELSFDVVSGIDVRNGVHMAQEEGVDFGVVCPHCPMVSMA